MYVNMDQSDCKIIARETRKNSVKKVIIRFPHFVVISEKKE